MSSDALHGSELPSSSDHLAQLRRALLEAHRTRQYESAPLRQAVNAFAQSSRAEHISPERMFLTMVELLDDPDLAGLGSWWRSVLRDRMLFWGVQAYYDMDLGDPDSQPEDPSEG